MHTRRPGAAHATIRRRTLLASTLLATGLIPVGSAAVAEVTGAGCRAWCLSYCDNVCRDGDRPACGGG